MNGKRRRLALYAGVVVAAIALGLLVWGVPFTGQRQQQIALGRSVYQAQCAQCHGRALEGQPDWQTPLPSGRLPAPPHDASGHTWHHSDDMLVGVTRNGLKPYAGADYESDMPAFAGKLGDAEINSVIEFIKSTWPERERDYQRRVTEQSKAMK